MQSTRDGGIAHGTKIEIASANFPSLYLSCEIYLDTLAKLDDLFDLPLDNDVETGACT